MVKGRTVEPARQRRCRATALQVDPRHLQRTVVQRHRSGSGLKPDSKTERWNCFSLVGALLAGARDCALRASARDAPTGDSLFAFLSEEKSDPQTERDEQDEPP